MQKSADSLICLFNKKQREKFTGGIKLGFEQGRLVNCTEYSDPERTPPPLPDGFSLHERLKMACTNGFYGSLLFIFKDGIITNTSTVQTWASQGIQSLLEESSVGGIGAKLS
jgi:hypothetical protein